MAVTFFFFFLLLASNLFCQFEKGTIDTVYGTSFGKNTQFGQSNTYFPMNIFGLPDSSARKDNPTSSENQVCALGLDGSITVGFRNKILRDMPGCDFTIFENAFEFMDERIFIEPAMVQVSKDGETFISFPFDSLTLQGCAGMTPTFGNEDSFSPDVSGGNSFDLADIGLDSIIAIRIIDVSSILLDQNHPFYSPIVNGFDLDAVVAMHLQSTKGTPFNESDSTNFQSLSVNSLHIQPRDGEIIELYNLDGRLLLQSNSNQIDYSVVGTYLLVVKHNKKIKRNVIQIY